MNDTLYSRISEGELPVFSDGKSDGELGESIRVVLLQKGA